MIDVCTLYMQGNLTTTLLEEGVKVWRPRLLAGSLGRVQESPGTRHQVVAALPEAKNRQSRSKHAGLL